MPGHKLTLRIKSRPASEKGGPDSARIETELLIDGKRAALVQDLAFHISADTMLPVVFLKLVPGEVDIEIESPAAFHLAMAQAQKGFFRGLGGELAPPMPPPPPDFTPVQAAEARREWEKAFPVIPAAAVAEARQKDLFGSTPGAIVGGPPEKIIDLVRAPDS